MEDMPKPPGEVRDDSEDDDGLAERRRRSFSESLISLLEKQKKPDEDEEDDEESKENDKSFAGRLRSSLKRLFPRIVEKPKTNAEEAQGPASKTELITPNKTEFTMLAAEDLSIEPESTPSTAVETREPALPEAEKPPESAGLEEELPIADLLETQTPESAEPAVTPTAGSGGEQSGLFTPSAASAEQVPEQLPTKHGTRAALIAFLAGEIFSRSRDRKLRRKDAKQQREIEGLKKRQQKADAEAMLKNLQDRQTLRRTTAMETQNSSQTKEQLIERHPEMSQTGPLGFEQPTLKPTNQNEVVSTLVAGDLHPERNKEFIIHNRNVRPEAVLEQVEVAAEKNIPIESLYERRQEIKDRRGDLAALSARSRPGQQGASPVSSVLDSPEFDQARQMVHRAKRSITARQNTNVYKRAARGGFWAAILVVIALCAILLLR